MTSGVSVIQLCADAGAERWRLANAAAAAAPGEILLFLPSDATASPQLTSRVAEAHAGRDPRMLVGEVAVAAASHPLAHLRRAKLPDASPGPVDYEGQSFSVPTALFHSAGGFATDVEWGADVELAFRMAGRGAVLERMAGVAAEPHRPRSATDVVRARVAAGRGSVALYRRTPALLPHLELGAYHADGPPALWLRRGLLAAGAAPLPAALGGLLPTRALRRRWLRFQYEYHFWRGVRQVLRGAEWHSLVHPPVILMYHAIGRTGERPGCYVVPVARFRRQMRWLALRGYRVMPLEALLDCRRTFRLPPARSVVITFDDGYADNAELALPLLRAHRFRAAFFLVSGSIGGRNEWDDSGELAGRALLTLGDIRRMADAGMEFGAHTRTHPVLPDLADAALADEVHGARVDLERTLERPMRAFAYPFGRLDDRVTAAVGAAGFDLACCSRSGVNDPGVPALRLRRVEVRGTDSLMGFAFAVQRGWVRRRRRP